MHFISIIQQFGLLAHYMTVELLKVLVNATEGKQGHFYLLVQFAEFLHKLLLAPS